MNRTANNMTNSYGRSLDRTKAETFWFELIVADVIGVDSVEVNVELVTVGSDAVVCELISTTGVVVVVIVVISVEGTTDSWNHDM